MTTAKPVEKRGDHELTWNRDSIGINAAERVRNAGVDNVKQAVVEADGRSVALSVKDDLARDCSGEEKSKRANDEWNNARTHNI
jgi:hypothetical protein